MSSNLELKKQVVEEIKENFSNSKSLVFVEYAGVSVEADTKLRKELRNNNCKYKVYKNRLVARALASMGIDGTEKLLEGPLAVAMGDEVSPSKILTKACEENSNLVIKFAILDNKIVGLDEVKALSKMPSKEVLVAKLLGSLNAPATNLVGILNGPIRALTCALNAIAQKQN